MQEQADVSIRRAIPSREAGVVEPVDVSAVDIEAKLTARALDPDPIDRAGTLVDLIVPLPSLAFIAVRTVDDRPDDSLVPQQQLPRGTGRLHVVFACAVVPAQYPPTPQT